MLIVTNRNIVKSNFKDGVGDEGAFGDDVNSKGPNEVRLAYAEKKQGKWRVELVKEPSRITARNIPSRKEFSILRDKLTQSKKNCVFFVHGFNQDLLKNLEKSLAIEKQHGVEVVAFSWPSNPGGFKTNEYRHAKRTAKASVGALDATLEKLGRYLQEPFNREALEACETKFSFLSHSLGGFLFQNYVRDSSYDDETNIFENVILCQADVDSPGHEAWVDQIEAGKRTYVTINENDWVLKWSDANFQKDRLGRTARDLVSRSAGYFDFTDGPNVGTTHGLFYKKTNDVVKAFFTEVLNGRRGESVAGLNYDARSNAYRF
ncbi:MAG: alpha/beta hydrolase [Candidatus Thiodiazotropha sp. (ex Monitilora ramsayi)]|nr:alpha/beta hydrolase [Candidatus Thiodiazotropha sp. (ex Monitilora ramsayi)]